MNYNDWSNNTKSNANVDSNKVLEDIFKIYKGIEV